MNSKSKLILAATVAVLALASGAAAGRWSLEIG
jgi:hypothetical protein